MAAKVTFSGVIAESATGSDVDAALALFRASIVELATISDLVVGRPLWEIIDDTQTANWQNINNVQSSGWTQINDVQSAGWTTIDTN
jgi:hypothetical protein